MVDRIKQDFENFCTNEGQLKPVTTTSADKGKVRRKVMERFPSLSFLKANNRLLSRFGHVQLERISEVGELDCLSYCPCSRRMVKCLEKLWTFFRLKLLLEEIWHVKFA